MASNQLQGNGRRFGSTVYFAPLIIIVVLWCFILFVAPIGKHILLDVDEGSVGMKGMLYQQGYRAFVDFQSDQPPLLCMLLGGWFRLFDAGLWSGRFLVWVFSGIFLAAFYNVTADRSSRLGGMLAVLVLFSSCYFLRLSISLMEIVPSWALAMSAVAVLGSPQNLKSRARIILSSALFALSMTITLNTVLILPGLLVEMALAGGVERKDKIRNSLMWMSGWVGTFIVLAVWWRFDFRDLLSAHIGSPPQEQFGDDTRGFYQVPYFFLSEIPAIILVLSGLVAGGRRFIYDAMLPFSWLAVTTVVLLFDVPVWWHDEFLLAMPLAMLAGAAVVSWCSSSSEADQFNKNNYRIRWAILGFFALIAIPGRMVSSAWIMHGPLYAMDGRILSSLQEARASGSKTAAAIHHQGYLVESGLFSPPHLAGYSMKKIAVGDLNGNDLIEKWSPDVLLFYRDDVDMRLALAMREKYFPTNVADGVLLFKKKQATHAPPDLATFTRQSVAISPYDREAQIELARMLKSSGQDAEACARYRMVLRWSEGYPEWIMEIAALLATSGDVRVRNCEEAFEWVNYGAEKFPWHSDMAETKRKISQLCAGSVQP